MNEPFLTLENLAIGYDGQPVLSDISLTVAPGSFTAILGANGSGKSTLLKTLLGLQPPVAGTIRIAGGSEAVLGYVPQTTQFDPLYLLTAYEVALMGTYRRVGPGRFVPRREKDFVHECLAATGAEGFARRRLSELSGGQRQRVLIARALATRPDALVLDEPTAGVDVRATKAVLEFLSKMHEERKLTILLVTHDLPVVRQHAQQVIWLHQGRVFHGSVADVLTPARMQEIFEMEIS